MYDLLTANAECSSQALVDVVLGCFPGRGLFLDLPFELSFVPCALSPLCLHPLSCRGFCRAHLGHSLWILGHLDFSQASCWLIHLLILTFVSLSLLLTVDFELTCMSDRLSQDLRDLTQAIQQLTIVTRGLASQTGSASDGVQSSASSSPRSSSLRQSQDPKTGPERPIAQVFGFERSGLATPTTRAPTSQELQQGLIGC